MKNNQMSRCLQLIFVSLLLLSYSFHGYTDAVFVKSAREIGSKVAYACEESRLTLNCSKDGGIIRIVRANYGRFTLSVCNPWQVNKGWNVQCSAKNSTTVVSERCDGQVVCMILASNTVFGDPCVNTNKYLQTYYYCEPTETTKKTTTPKTTTSKPSTRPVTTTSSTSTTKSTKTTTSTTTTTTAATTTANKVVTTQEVNSSPKPITTSQASKLTTVKPTPQKYCHDTWAEGVYWSTTPVGQTAERPCPEGKKGMMTWLCGVAGWIREPDTINCVSLWVDSLEQMINETDITQTAKVLRDQTSNKVMGAGDLKKTTEVLFPKLNVVLRDQLNMSNSPQERKKKLRSFTDSITATGSNLLSKEQSASWKALPASERSKVASSLVVNMEETGFTIAANVEVNQTIISADVNILLQVSVRDVSTQSHGDIKLPSHTSGNWTRYNDRVSIPVESLKVDAKKGVAQIVFLVYNNLQQWMDPSSSSSEENKAEEYTNNATDAEQEEKPKPYIASNIFSASINNPKENLDLPKPIEFTLQHKKRREDGYEPICSYWKMEGTLEGEWSDTGCWVTDSNDTHTTCRCNHLTNFAVLMDVTGTKLTPVHEITLMSITYVGCIVSIICLFLSFFTFSFFKNLQCDRNTIHKNLVLCLMLAEIVFIVGISLTQNKIICAIVAGLLHFLFLASFSWMCLEGVQLYVMLIEVFEAERSRKKWYYLIGYGVPIVIVAISSGIQPSGYGTDRHCWLRTDTAFIWSFVGPVIGVLAVNIVMLSIAVYMMCKHANTLASSLRTKEKSRMQKINQDPNSGSSSASTTMLDEKTRTTLEIPAWIKGAVVLVVLLGLTWAFGLLFISQDTVAMAYIFTFLNSLQGLFIFVFHCLMNEKVKKEYKKLAYRSTWLPNCLRNICVGFSGSMSYSPHNSTSSGGNLLKFWSGKRRRKSSGSTTDKSYKGHKRRSDPRSDSEFFTSRDTNSVFSRGSNRHSNKTNNGTTNGHVPKKLYQETDGIMGDLSIMDCSVIDSEYVTEYCQNHMNVSTENKRYSSGSEDVVDVYDENQDKNRLSILSEDSAIKNNSDFASMVAEIDECSQTEFSGDEFEKPSSLGNIEREPLMGKTQSEKNLFNYLLNQNGNKNVDPEGEKLYPGSVKEIYLYQNCLSSGEEINNSTPNLKFTSDVPTKIVHDDETNNSVLSSLPDLMIVEEGDIEHEQNMSHSLDLQPTNNSNAKNVVTLSSDSQTKADSHRYNLGSSDC